MQGTSALERKISPREKLLAISCLVAGAAAATAVNIFVPGQSSKPVEPQRIYTHVDPKKVEVHGFQKDKTLGKETYMWDNSKDRVYIVLRDQDGNLYLRLTKNPNQD